MTNPKLTRLPIANGILNPYRVKREGKPEDGLPLRVEGPGVSLQFDDLYSAAFCATNLNTAHLAGYEAGREQGTREGIFSYGAKMLDEHGAGTCACGTPAIMVTDDRVALCGECCGKGRGKAKKGRE